MSGFPRTAVVGDQPPWWSSRSGSFHLPYPEDVAAVGGVLSVGKAWFGEPLARDGVFARLFAVAVDCVEPYELARFYPGVRRWRGVAGE